MVRCSCRDAGRAWRASVGFVPPQGQPERNRRVLKMVEVMDASGFGNCTNEGECEAACPKGTSLSNIARLNREYLRAAFSSQE